MNEYLDPTDDQFSPEEQDIDRALRPLNFDDFAGRHCWINPWIVMSIYSTIRAKIMFCDFRMELIQF